ncbi:isoprenylcysteine carboxylmethyltransferase family protein [bacterium]|nr:isoprenylcysteine carboxylmethyltransferase family protein [bacterium]
MIEIIFKILFVALFIIYITIRVPFDKTYQRQEIIKKANLLKEKFSLLLISLGLLLMPLLWVFTSYLNFSKMEFPIWVRLTGIAISIVSLLYFYRIHKTLGANWSPTLEIKKGHQLIKTGPYKTIRHPMYAQMWLWTIAQVLIISNVIAGLSGIIAFAIFYFMRVGREEKMMIGTFGDEYVEYMKLTGRVFPKCKRNV